MTFDLTFLIVLTLAASGAVELWFGGSIFENRRIDAETWKDEGRWRIQRFLGELFTCSFCLSYHATFWPAMLAAAVADTRYAVLVNIILYALAATRLGNLIHAWAPIEARYDDS